MLLRKTTNVSPLSLGYHALVSPINWINKATSLEYRWACLSVLEPVLHLFHVLFKWI